MTIQELTNFYKQDNNLYELNTNENFLKYLNTKIKKGYNFNFTIEELQELIDYIVNWYEIKYPEKELAYYNGIKNSKFSDIKSLSKAMNIDQLLYRLTSNQLKLLESGYQANGSYQIPIENKEKTTYKIQTIVLITRKNLTNYSNDLSYFFLKIDYLTGRVLDIDELDEYISPKNLNLEQLYLILKNKFNQEFDLSNIENCIKNHEFTIELRDKILQLTALKLLYSKNTIPLYGYIRTKRFISEFNKKLNLTLSSNEIDELTNKDYRQEKNKIKSKSKK